MKTFELIVDEKVKIWRRTSIEIKAESLEEAVKECINNGICNASEVIDFEYLEDTEESLDSIDDITVEVMDTSYNTLGTK